GRGADQAGLAAGDAVHGTVHLDQVIRALGDREHVKALPTDGHGELEPAGLLDVRLHRTAVQLHVVAEGPAAGPPQPVGLTADPDVGLVPGLVPDLGPPALSR